MWREVIATELGGASGATEVASLPDDQRTGAAQNLRAVLARVRSAALDAGRQPESVSLVAVSKLHGPDAIRSVLEQGQRLFGESRVQEASRKWPELRAEYPDIELHMLGRLQSNKARAAVALFDVIESVDSPGIAEALGKEMRRSSRYPGCLVQVNTGLEAQKGGVDPAEADDLIRACREDFDIPIRGLMCIPPWEGDRTRSFALLKQIAERNALETVSMGMTDDFQVAIGCGATHVRVGRGIFGERPAG